MRTRQAGESALLLLDAVDLLERAGISYAVVGAMAAAGFVSEARHGDPDDPIVAVLSLSDEFGNRVDLLLGLRGLGADAYTRATVIPFQNSQLRVVGREDFIAMKLFAHGPQDRIDAEHALLAAAYGPETLAALERLLAR